MSYQQRKDNAENLVLEVAVRWVKEMRKENEKELKRLLAKPAMGVREQLISACVALEEVYDDIPF